MVYKKKTEKIQLLVGGFNPSENYESIWIISPNTDENKKYLKPPPRLSDYHNLTPSSLPKSASILSNSQSPQKDRRVATRGFARNASCDPKTSQVTSDAEESTSIRSR